MSERWKGMTTNRAILRYFALVSGFCFAFSGIALADDCGTVATNGWRIKNPPAEDRQAIQDLLFRYLWMIDERDIDEKKPEIFAELFAQPGSSYYEMCNTGGSIFKLTLGLKPESPYDLLTQMAIIARQLKEEKLQTRHLVTNTLFDMVDDKGKTVNTKSIVLVTVQDAHSSTPSLDYSADARATFVKGDDNIWRFQSLTIHADYPDVAAKKR